MSFVSAIIVAGGSSRRMGGTDKLMLSFGGRTVLERAVGAFARHPLITEVVVVCGVDRMETVKRMVSGLPTVTAVVPGGDTRSASVRNGIAAASPDAEYYAIHDGARPFVTEALITAAVEGAMRYGAAAPGIPVSDTLKRVDGAMSITETVPRDSLVGIQTPQVFEATLYRAAAKHGGDETDDCALIERLGRKVLVVPGDRDNLKITMPADIAAAQRIERGRAMRIGHGYDVHRLVEGRRLVLGGVDIPYEKGLLGHSDADVLTHALCDALLGAAGLPDIGRQFPDSDPAYEGADSILLLQQVCALVRAQGWEIENVDVTVLCQRPRLRDYIDVMRGRLAEAMAVEPSRVGVKATTEEGLGFTGAGDGIAAHAVALVRAAL